MRGMLGAGLALAVVPSTAVSAAPLCLANDVVTSLAIVLPTAKLKKAKAKVKPLVGHTVASGGAMPVSGLSIVGADGMSLVVALEGPRVNVSSGGGGGLTPADFFFPALFSEADGRLDVGDTSSQGLVGAATATFTVIDCDTVLPFP